MGPILTPWSVWLVYVTIDVTVLAVVGFTPRLALLATISHVTKLAAVYLGAIHASRTPSAMGTSRA